MPAAKGQGRANSGVYLQSRYEVQVLDSFGEEPVLDGCGRVVPVPEAGLEHVPAAAEMADLRYHLHRPAGPPDEAKIRNARVTVWLNGVKVHNNVELADKTGSGNPEEPLLLPMRFQDHGNPVRFRNIWLIDRGLAADGRFPVYPPNPRQARAKSEPKPQPKPDVNPKPTRSKARSKTRSGPSKAPTETRQSPNRNPKKETRRRGEETRRAEEGWRPQTAGGKTGPETGTREEGSASSKAGRAEKGSPAASGGETGCGEESRTGRRGAESPRRKETGGKTGGGEERIAPAGEARRRQAGSG